MLWSVISGLFYITIFPRLSFSFLAWFVFIPLFFSLKNCNLGKSFLHGFIAGLISSLGLIYWICPAVMLGTNDSLLLTGISYFLLVIYLAIYWGIFTLLLKLIEKKYPLLSFLLFAPCLWVALELLRTYLFTGFPWVLLGNSQWNFLQVIQISEYTGVYGVSFLIMLVNSGIYVLLQQKKYNFIQKLTAGIIVSVVFFLNLFFGSSVLKNKISSPEKIKIALLQGNISQDIKWDENYRNFIQTQYLFLAERAATKQPQVIIWPETATPLEFFHPLTQEWINDVVRKTNSYHIIGAAEEKDGFYYNSAFLVSPRGEILNQYRKIKLVPFGEYIPLRPWITRIIPSLNEYLDCTSGKDWTIFRINNFDFGVLICFESIFGDLARKFVKNGADILVNITNIAWFLNTSAPQQHFMHQVFRAVENRVFSISVGNTGISGFVNPYGEIISRSEIFQTTYLVEEVGKKVKDTFYTSFGDIFAYLCSLICLVLLVFKRV